MIPVDEAVEAFVFLCLLLVVCGFYAVVYQGFFVIYDWKERRRIRNINKDYEVTKDYAGSCPKCGISAYACDCDIEITAWTREDIVKNLERMNKKCVLCGQIECVCEDEKPTNINVKI